MRSVQNREMGWAAAGLLAFSSVGGTAILGRRAPAVHGSLPMFAGDGVSVANADFIFVGEAPGDRAGYWVDNGGDVDGDGREDLVIGAEYNDEGGKDAGKGYLFLASSVIGRERQIPMAEADYTFVGEAPESWAARCIASAGDVDADGLGDLVVGAARYGRGLGRTYIYLGKNLPPPPAKIMLGDSADYVITGEAEIDGSGRMVGTAGDVDGDGLSDLLIWSYFNERGGYRAGSSYLVTGATLKAAPKHLKLGRDEDHIFVGPSGTMNSGIFDPGSGSDIDGDGLDDVVFGAQRVADYGFNSGATYVFLGKSLESAPKVLQMDEHYDYALVGTVAYQRSGRFISSPGDVDGDGRDDILIGAFAARRFTGKIFLLLAGSLPPPPAAVTLDRADYVFLGEFRGDNAGRSMAPRLDADGDGRPDLLLGGYRNDFGGNAAGRSYLFLNKNLPEPPATLELGIDQDFSFLGEAPNDRAGRYLSSLDLNGDGASDLLIAAPLNDLGGANAGKAYVILGTRM